MREIIKEWAEKRGADIGIETKQRFARYAELIHDVNSRFNITGLKTEEEIMEKLILGSLDPLCDINVPRGTTFADIGSGAGIPGLPVAIFFKGVSGVLIESNNKKADFIRRTANELGLKTIEVIHDRAENIANLKNFREGFDWCFSRALAHPYIAVEIGGPFVKTGGFLYIYSGEANADGEVCSHAEKIGLVRVSAQEREAVGLRGPGILLRKAAPSPNGFPRSYPAIKRDAERIAGVQIEDEID